MKNYRQKSHKINTLEVGLHLNDDADLSLFGRMHVSVPHLDYIFHMFFRKFEEFPPLQLELKEHSEMLWVSYAEAKKMSLVHGAQEALDFYYSHRSNSK